MSTSDCSPDESGYITSRVRRDDTEHDDYDPSEHSYEEDSADSSARSSVPMPVPIPTGEGTSRGPRTIRTARKRVLPLRRVTFTIPSVPSGEPSQSRSRSRSVTPPPPAIGVPVPPPQGMTTLERDWVTGLADRVGLHQSRLDYHQYSLDDLFLALNTQNAYTTSVLGVALDAKRTIRRLYAYLFWVIGALVVMLGVLIGMLIR